MSRGSKRICVRTRNVSLLQHLPFYQIGTLPTMRKIIIYFQDVDKLRFPKMTPQKDKNNSVKNI